jgi:hypothetical protein
MTINKKLAIDSLFKTISSGRESLSASTSVQPAVEITDEKTESEQEDEGLDW